MNEVIEMLLSFANVPTLIGEIFLGKCIDLKAASIW